MSLVNYRKRRRFQVTPEPRGRSPRPRRSGLRYVIQKHRATALHYDFRLEWKGVMLSWAVPKGPSLDPSVKRMAMPTEDHPIEYNKFEGVIPEGEYGGGTVMIWDRGTWTPETEDVDDGLKKGELKFRLDGEKLHGSWVLVRTRRAGERAPRLAPDQAPRRRGEQARHRRRGAALRRFAAPARRDRARRGRQHGEGGRRRSARAPAPHAGIAGARDAGVAPPQEVGLALGPPAGTGEESAGDPREREGAPGNPGRLRARVPSIRCRCGRPVPSIRVSPDPRPILPAPQPRSCPATLTILL